MGDESERSKTSSAARPAAAPPAPPAETPPAETPGTSAAVDESEATEPRFSVEGWRERARAHLHVSPHAIVGALHGLEADVEGLFSETAVKEALDKFREREGVKLSDDERAERQRAVDEQHKIVADREAEAKAAEEGKS